MDVGKGCNDWGGSGRSFYISTLGLCVTKPSLQVFKMYRKCGGLLKAKIICKIISRRFRCVVHMMASLCSRGQRKAVVEGRDENHPVELPPSHHHWVLGHISDFRFVFIYAATASCSYPPSSGKVKVTGFNTRTISGRWHVASNHVTTSHVCCHHWSYSL